MKYLKELIIIILIAVILLQRACSGDGKKAPCPEADTLTTIEYVHDTVWHTTERVSTRPPVVIVEKTIPPDVDSTAILQQFHNAYFYSEIFADSVEIITINDTISRNQITWRDVKYNITRPQTVITKNIITPPAEQHAKLFVGASIGSTSEEVTSLTPSIMFLSKTHHAYVIGYNLQAKAVEMGAYWKIRLRK